MAEQILDSERQEDAPASRPTLKTKTTRPSPKLAEESTIVLTAIGCSILEPHQLIWFLEGRPVEVQSISKWMQSQIEAGLLQRG